MEDLKAAQDEQKAQEQKKKEVEARKDLMLSQILEHDAKERLARIALVRPDQARQIEAQLIQMAQSGQIVEKISEEKLKSMITQLAQGQQKGSKVSIQRKKKMAQGSDEESDDDWEI